VTLEFLKQNWMKKTPHPPCSLNLAASDFYLFGYFKPLLAEHEFPDRESFLETVGHILEGIEKVS
jgi:hypothetical protein